MATYFRLLDTARQFFDANGAVLAGGKITTYDAGTTTAKTTYQDNAGAVAHTNPIILDSAGRIPAAVWGTTGDYKLVITDANDAAIDTDDNLPGVNDVAANTASEWVTFSGTPTRTGATTFTVAGDQTSIFHAGRRLQATDSSVLYGFVKSASYSDPTTTVTVVLDSGSLTASLSAVAYGLNSRSNTSLGIYGEQTRFRIEQNSTENENLSASTWTSLNLTTEALDIGGDVASSTFTVPAAGTYLFTWQVLCVSISNANRLLSRLYDTNGSNPLHYSNSIPHGATSFAASIGAAILVLDGTETIRLQAWQNEGGTTDILASSGEAGATYLAGVRIA